MIVLAAVAFGAAVTAPIPAATATTPSPAELVARNRAAAGRERDGAERESWSVHSSGLSGTLAVIRQGADSSATMLLGPFRTQQGSVHGQRWHQNDNGETVVERPEPSQTERPLSESVERVREPSEAWAVTSTFASGHVKRTYYDARSYLVVRSEKTAGGRTIRTTYDDFKPDARGRLRAAHYFGGDDRPGSDFDYRLVSDEPVAAAGPAELAVPNSRRALVEFPPGATSVRLPARIEAGRIYVRLTIGARALDFLLDSGSSSIALDEAVARSLGLLAYGRTSETIAGTFAAQRVIVPALGLGPLVMHDVVVRTGPLAENEGAHTRVVGLLGFDFLDAVGLKVDYGAGTVDALRPGAWVAPPGSIPLPIRLNAQVPVMAVTVGEATGEDFIVDTGTPFDLVLFQRFVRAHAATAGTVTSGAVRYGNGVGGSVPYRPFATDRMTLGPLAFSKPAAVAALPPAALGFDTNDGLVGSGALAHFSVFFDYAGERLYLAPPARIPGLRSTGPRSPRPMRGGGNSGRPGDGQPKASR